MEEKRKKILIVEDDVDLRKILVGRIKSDFNYILLEAGDGQEAIDLVFAEKPDLLLLDLLLPKLNGFEVLSRVRHHTDPAISKLKVIVLSNLWSNKDILMIQALKIEEYYVKANTNLSDVLEKIKKIMDVGK